MVYKLYTSYRKTVGSLSLYSIVPTIKSLLILCPRLGLYTYPEMSGILIYRLFWIQGSGLQVIHKLSKNRRFSEFIFYCPYYQVFVDTVSKAWTIYLSRNEWDIEK